MAAAGIFLKLCFLLSLIAGATNLVAAGKPLPNCNRTECPQFTFIDGGDGFEICQYNASVWITTDPIQDISIVNATKGFISLFNYFQGKNDQGLRIQMTAPVIFDVLRGENGGEPSSTASFYIPKKIEANPPMAAGLSVQRRTSFFTAVRQFDGFVAKYDIGAEVSKLQASLAGTVWADIVARAENAKIKYIVAQYNGPFEVSDRVNEIWVPFPL